MPPELVALADWIAAEYCSTPPRALGLVLPPGAATAAQRAAAAALSAPAAQLARRQPRPACA